MNNLSPQQVQILTQLGLAIGTIYLPAGDAAKVVAASNLLVTALANFREASGRPDGWVPSPEEWAALIADRESKTIEALRAQAGLPATPQA